MNPNEQETQPQPQQPIQPPAAPAPPSTFEQPIAPQPPVSQPTQVAPVPPVGQMPIEPPIAAAPITQDTTQQPLAPTPTPVPEFQQPYQPTAAQPPVQTFAPTPAPAPIAPAAQVQEYTTPQATSSITPPAQPEVPEPVVNPEAAQFAAPGITPPEQSQGVSPYTVTPTPGPQKKSFNFKPIIIALIVIIVLVAGYFGITFLLGKLGVITTSSATNKSGQKSIARSGAPEINTLPSFSFIQPDASKLAGLTLRPSPSNPSITNLMSADTMCSVSYGIQAQSKLPGETLGDVVGQIVSRLQQKYGNVLQITGPTDTDALVLKATNGKSYALPSAIFKYSANSKDLTGALVAKYSISELSDKSHATVGVFCSSDDPKALPTLAQRVNDLAPVAAAIGIKVQ